MSISSVERADLRLDQIVQRLISKHPKAAKDPELIAMLRDLSDIIDNEVMDSPVSE